MHNYHMYEIYTKIPLVFILPYVNVQHYYGMYKKKSPDM